MGDGEGETVKKTDTGNLEKETRHVVKRERQQGVRYLNKKETGARARIYKRGLKCRRYFGASTAFDAVNAQK